MKKILSAICFIAIISATVFSGNPQAKISNGILNATLYLPDPENGYHRGTRFDWSGQISTLTYKGHSFFGQWYEKYDPYQHDAIMGPVESFDPIGYDEAKPGATFVKIGIGALVKPGDKEYFFADPYDISNPGKWTVKKASDKIRFTHTLNDTAISYVYTKIVQLTKNKPQLILYHTLKNIGKKPIETNVMNHNFFVIDNEITGSDFEVDLPFEASVDKKDGQKAASIRGKKIILESGNPQGKDFYLGPITGYSDDPSDYNITVRNKKTRAAVNIVSDRPFSRLAFWATVKTVCPEPFIHVKADPGQAFTWKIVYTFSVDDRK